MEKNKQIEVTWAPVENDKLQEVVWSAKGLERQNLHNSALVVLYHPELKNDRALYDSARNYLINLFIHSIDALSQNIGGEKQ